MNITVVYKVGKQGDGIQLTRQGELKVLPPGFVEGQDKLTVSQTVLVRLLRKFFDKVFREEIVGDGIQFDGEFQKVGSLAVGQVAASVWLEPTTPHR